LDPDKSLVRIYSTYISASDLKKFQERSKSLLKATVSTEEELSAWITSVHKLLGDISNSSQGSNLGEDAESEGDRSKGIISSKALPTYLNQWKMFVREKIGPLYGIVIGPDDCSPLVEKLKELEKESNRSWTTIVSDITEIRTTTSFQKRVSSQTRTASNFPELINEPISLKGKTCNIQRSVAGYNQELVNQFLKAMRARLFLYSGKGIFSASIRLGDGVITVELPNATKSDLGIIEEYLNLLLK
jgi:hypothetical protein